MPFMIRELLGTAYFTENERLCIREFARIVIKYIFILFLVAVLVVFVLYLAGIVEIKRIDKDYK